jgi:hypothetical protein
MMMMRSRKGCYTRYIIESELFRVLHWVLHGCNGVLHFP